MISESLKINTTLTTLWLSGDEIEVNKNMQQNRKYKIQQEKEKQRNKMIK